MEEELELKRRQKKKWEKERAAEMGQKQMGCQAGSSHEGCQHQVSGKRRGGSHHELCSPSPAQQQ